MVHISGLLHEKYWGSEKVPRWDPWQFTTSIEILIQYCDLRADSMILLASALILVHSVTIRPGLCLFRVLSKPGDSWQKVFVERS